MDEPVQPKPLQLRDAYVPNRRVRYASDIAALCAAGLLLGLLGSALTWSDRSVLFDLAANSRQTVKIGTGYLAGPVLIITALPLVLGRSRQLALKRLYRLRIVVAAGLWAAGLAILIDKVSNLDGYSLQAGAYVAGGLLLVGLLATLTMWPSGLGVVKVGRNGMQRLAPGL